MIYQKATLNDLDNFFDFFAKSLKKYFLRIEKDSFEDYTMGTLDYFCNDEYSKNNLRKWINDNKKIIYLALDNNKIRGFLIVDKPEGGVAYGEWLAVDENHRGKKIATTLLRTWEKDALSWGCHKVRLYTEKRNLKFYEKQGYIYVGVIPKHYCGADDYIFYKELQEPMEENYLREYLKKRKQKTRNM